MMSFSLPQSNGLMIAKKQHWEEEMESDGFQGPTNYNPSEIIGSGPMKFESWDKDASEVTLLKHEDHFDPIAYDGRISKSVPGVESALGQMANGEIDITLELVGNMDAVKSIVNDDDDLSIASALSVTAEWITYNLSRRRQCQRDAPATAPPVCS